MTALDTLVLLSKAPGKMGEDLLTYRSSAGVTPLHELCEKYKFDQTLKVYHTDADHDLADSLHITGRLGVLTSSGGPRLKRTSTMSTRRAEFAKQMESHRKLKSNPSRVVPVASDSKHDTADANIEALLQLPRPKRRREPIPAHADVVRDTAMSPDGWKLISGEKGVVRREGKCNFLLTS